MNYGDIRDKLALRAFATLPEMIEIKNPHRRWWQFWKPKTVRVFTHSPDVVRFKPRSG